jgi:hypothetical protein
METKKRKEENLTEESSPKKKKQQEYVVSLCEIGTRRKIEIPAAKPVILGRGKTLHILDKKVSVGQVQITRNSSNDDFCLVKCVSENFPIQPSLF